MNILKFEVDAVLLTEVPGLDQIHVFWQDVGDGQGYCTIICYGAAWTVYFGAMGGREIRQFFAEVDTEYLVAKMGITPQLKATKRDHAYLARIIDAVKESLNLSTCLPVEQVEPEREWATRIRRGTRDGEITVFSREEYARDWADKFPEHHELIWRTPAGPWQNSGEGKS